MFLHLHLGRFQSAASIFKKLADSLEPQALAEARDRFATLYLVTGEAMSAFLPAEDPIIAHGRAARSALEAYCRGDDEESLRALAGIPFRSPYRDWVSILKALLKFHSEAAEAAALLSRIPATSPFAAIARSAELALLAEPDFLERLPKLGQIQRRFVARLRGWSLERLSLWEMMRPLGAQPNPDSLLELMQRYRTRLGADWVRRQGMRLLIDQRKGRPDRPHPALGGALSAFERSLLHAWRAEEEADHRDVYYGWMEKPIC